MANGGTMYAVECNHCGERLTTGESNYDHKMDVMTFRVPPCPKCCRVAAIERKFDIAFNGAINIMEHSALYAKNQAGSVQAHVDRMRKLRAEADGE